MRVLGSLHPSMARGDYEFLCAPDAERGHRAAPAVGNAERGHRAAPAAVGPFAIAEEPLSHVMAAADVSINAFPTTTLWSLVVGAATLYLDLWQQGYDVDGLPGCIVVRDRAQLHDAIHTARTTPRRAPEQDRALLPPFDGRC